MKKFITLLKYLDRSKATPEAVLEIAHILGYAPDKSEAAEVAEAFRTRGPAGLLAKAPILLAWPKEHAADRETQYIECQYCGRMNAVDL